MEKKTLKWMETTKHGPPHTNTVGDGSTMDGDGWEGGGTVELLKGTSVRGQLHAIYLYQALEQQSGILGNVNTGTTNKVE
jgi:hypothetical protein